MAGDFAALAALVMMTILILAFLRLLETVVVGQLIKAALQHHPESVSGLAAKLGRHRSLVDEIFGWVLTALAAGLAIFGMLGGGSDPSFIVKFAVVPAIIGLTIIAYYRLRPDPGTGQRCHSPSVALLDGQS